MSITTEIKSKFRNVDQQSYETIGPTIGAETLKNAIYALIVASILIVIYITWSFRSVPKPTSSFRFGVCAIIALIHDVLVLLGLFSIFGHFFGVEVDSLFVTAALTVIGFSVHDTIVVFDRIRENLKRVGGEDFPEVVNDSILQTLDRSLKYFINRDSGFNRAFDFRRRNNQMVCGGASNRHNFRHLFVNLQRFTAFGSLAGFNQKRILAKKS